MDLRSPKNISPVPGHKQCLDVEKSDTFMKSSKGNCGKNLGAPEGKATEETMSDGGIFKAEVVYIRDSEDGGAGEVVQQETYTATQPHKIKLSYKALAAIPTNTLLLEQQVIDDQVDKERDPQDLLDICVKEDTHVKMCSPAQLRQQSEELYAVIDEVLVDPIPMCQTSPAHRRSREMMDKGAKRFTSLPTSLGRETKYATYNLTPPATSERKQLDPFQTKPGVIRPANIIPRLTEEDYDEEYRPNPFKQYLEELTDHNKPTHPIVTSHENEALSSNKLENTQTGADGNISSGSQTFSKERKSPTTVIKETLSASALLITESERPDSSHAEDVFWQGVPASFNPTKVTMEAFETDI